MNDESETPPVDRRHRFRRAEDREAASMVSFSRDISLGQVMQAGVVIVGLVAWAVTSNGRSEQNAKDLANLQTALGAQISDLRASLTSSLTDLRTQIAVLPDQRARLDVVERQLTQDGSRDNRLDQRIGDLERGMADVQARIGLPHGGLGNMR